jgi:hypothetical protein
VRGGVINVVVSRGSPLSSNTDTKPVDAKPKVTRRMKVAARQSQPSSRSEVKAKKLVCRYCGSEDLAPSFRKRRDARCRAGFKKRYGSAVRETKTRRVRKTRPRSSFTARDQWHRGRALRRGPGPVTSGCKERNLLVLPAHAIRVAISGDRAPIPARSANESGRSEISAANLSPRRGGSS